MLHAKITQESAQTRRDANELVRSSLEDRDGAASDGETAVVLGGKLRIQARTALRVAVGAIIGATLALTVVLFAATMVLDADGTSVAWAKGLMVVYFGGPVAMAIGAIVGGVLRRRSVIYSMVSVGRSVMRLVDRGIYRRVGRAEPPVLGLAESP